MGLRCIFRHEWFYDEFEKFPSGTIRPTKRKCKKCDIIQRTNTYLINDFFKDKGEWYRVEE